VDPQAQALAAEAAARAAEIAYRGQVLTLVAAICSGLIAVAGTLAGAWLNQRGAQAAARVNIQGQREIARDNARRTRREQRMMRILEVANRRQVFYQDRQVLLEELTRWRAMKPPESSTRETEHEWLEDRAKRLNSVADRLRELLARQHQEDNLLRELAWQHPANSEVQQAIGAFMAADLEAGAAHRRLAVCTSIEEYNKLLEDETGPAMRALLQTIAELNREAERFIDEP
jgi:hypothetical protein